MEKVTKEIEDFIITSVSREDLESAGFDAALTGHANAANPSVTNVIEQIIISDSSLLIHRFIS